MNIHFAHRTFRWESEAKGKAHVHVVIIGFAFSLTQQKHIWEYVEQDGDKSTRTDVARISPYLFEGSTAVLSNRTSPVSDVPNMKYGNKPTDGGNFLMSTEEKDALLATEPAARKFIRPYIGADEFLSGEERWCLWLVDISPTELRQLPQVYQRVERVKNFRLASKADTTRAYAKYPTLFRQIAQPESSFILVPGHTSETRSYIPFAFLTPNFIPSNACFLIPNAKPWHFGFLSSSMHMTWVRVFCGRIKSDFRYSKTIVYNNFPWPEAPTDKQRATVETKAQAVLDARARFPESCLADLYDPLTMPAALQKAHTELDRAVEACYRKTAFHNDRERVEFLFALYEKLSSPLLKDLPARKPQKR